MKLNLREIIEIPGGSVPFAQELDTALLDFPSVRAYTAPITAEGKVVNQIKVPEHETAAAKLALDRMLDIS